MLNNIQIVLKIWCFYINSSVISLCCIVCIDFLKALTVSAADKAAADKAAANKAAADKASADKAAADKTATDKAAADISIYFHIIIRKFIHFFCK